MSEHKHEGCSCHYHEHHHEHLQKKTYILEHLGCANCAAKMEKKINELPQVEEAIITFATKQLQVVSEQQEDLLPVLQQICASIESEVEVKEIKEEQPKEEHHYTEGIDIAIGTILFVVALLMKSVSGIGANIVFVCGYLCLGRNILVKAVKNIRVGHVMDEHFLMSIATLGAFTIGEFAEAVGVMLFFRIGELFESIAVERSRSQIMKAVDLRPETVLKVHGNHTHEIAAAHAKVGDVLLIRAGDRIPLDGTVIEGESQLDTSAVTGEPIPVSTRPGEAVLSGCMNLSGVLKVRVEKVLEESMVTRILHAVEHAAANKPRVDRFITRFARVYTPIVVSLALLTAIVPSVITGEYDKWIYTAISFLVISCPCALVLSVPLAFFSGIGVASRKGILFKGGLSMEILGKVQAIVMDKTGTITHGKFEVQECVSYGMFSNDDILAMAASCEQHSTHPIATSIMRAAKDAEIQIKQSEKTEEIAGKGIRATTTAGEILCGSRMWMEEQQITLTEQKETLGQEVLVAYNGVLVGHILIADKIKKEAKDAILLLKKSGKKTVMLTGDNEEHAKMVAVETGIELVYAKQLPHEKLERMQEIRATHGSVLYVGDGINDAPVLAGADVGAAMGNGADAAIEAADVVFMTSSVQAIPEAISISKKTKRIAVQNIVFALVMKVAVLILGVIGLANMWLAVFADTGVAMLCVLNSIRILKRK